MEIKCRLAASALAVSVAREFSSLLRYALGEEKMRKVRARNRAPSSLSTCASHDFCDANMVMLEALSSVTGIAEDDVDLGAMAGTINEAWDLAKKAEFRAAGIKE